MKPKSMSRRAKSRSTQKRDELDLGNARSRLEAKRVELEQSIANLDQAHPTPVDSLEANDGTKDNEDRAVDFLETQNEQSILTNQQALLTEVKHALQRINEGTYGYCQQCGQAIPPRRLEAIPWAQYDVRCAEQVEQRNLSREDVYDRTHFFSH